MRAFGRPAILEEGIAGVLREDHKTNRMRVRPVTRPGWFRRASHDFNGFATRLLSFCQVNNMFDTRQPSDFNPAAPAQNAKTISLVWVKFSRKNLCNCFYSPQNTLFNAEASALRIQRILSPREKRIQVFKALIIKSKCTLVLIERSKLRCDKVHGILSANMFNFLAGPNFSTAVLISLLMLAFAHRLRFSRIRPSRVHLDVVIRDNAVSLVNGGQASKPPCHADKDYKTNIRRM